MGDDGLYEQLAKSVTEPGPIATRVASPLRQLCNRPVTSLAIAVDLLSRYADPLDVLSKLLRAEAAGGSGTYEAMGHRRPAKTPGIRPPRAGVSQARGNEAKHRGLLEEAGFLIERLVRLDTSRDLLIARKR